MVHPEGAGKTDDARLGFDRRVRLEFQGAKLSSDGGLLVMRELDDALALSDLASDALHDSRRGRNTTHRIDGQFRQSVFSRLAGYQDVNDAERLSRDPVMRQIVGGRAVDAQAASRNQQNRIARRAEKRGRRARMMRIYSLIRTVPAASAAMRVSMAAKCLICAPDQATLTMNGMPFGGCRFRQHETKLDEGSDVEA